MKVTEFLLICIIVCLMSLMFLIKIESISIIKALKYPMIAATNTSYIKTSHVTIMDGKFDVAKIK